MAYINVPGKFKTTGYAGLADADQIAYSTTLDEDDEVVIEKSVKDVIDEIDLVNAKSLVDLNTKVTSIQNALDEATVSDEVTPESVTALSQKIDTVDNKISSLFIELTQEEYDALETKQEGVLYLIKENDSITE